MKRKLALFLIVCLSALGLNPVPLYAEQGNTGPGSENGYEEYLSVADAYGDAISYPEYRSLHPEERFPGKAIIIEAADYSRYENMEVLEYKDFKGKAGTSILTGEQGMVEWQVKVQEAGYYNLAVEYYPVEGKSGGIQRSVLIDGELPFSEAGIVEFERFWKNELDEIQVDNKGNDVRNRQVECPEWSEKRLCDSNGYYAEPFLFYLEPGVHTVTFLSQKEPMMIRRLLFEKPEQIPDYREVKEEYEVRKENGVRNKNETRNENETRKEKDEPGPGQENIVSGAEVITIQAEDAGKKSSPMLYGISDRSSPSLTPYDPAKVKINSIGGTNWKEAGQWIEWEFDISEAGLYQIAMHEKQDSVRGVPVKRKLMIDGTVPFEEMMQIDFPYKGDWTVKTLSDGEEPYLFYLQEGRHVLRLEAVLGDLTEYVRKVKTSLTGLNQIYYDIMMITGTQPDSYRDYQIEKKMPDLADRLGAERDVLKSVVDGLKQITGKSGEKEAAINTVIEQLGDFIKDVEKVVPKLADFKKNIGGIGTWLLQMNELPLQLDAIYLVPEGQEPPAVSHSFFSRLWHELRSVFYSFIVDYNSIGDVSEGSRQETLTVWIGTGRDQANALKLLIDEQFTKETGIPVNLMLVSMDTLLQATLAGQGPDAAMQVAGNLPMNYAMRGAVADLTQFEDFEQTAERFYESALVPYRFREQCYALPETQTFQMLFYRRDILNKQGIAVPQTWDDVNAAISVLSRNNMTFGMAPSPEQGFGMFLYQMGGEFYTEDGKASALDSDIAVNAFKKWTSYYTDYTLEREFDFANRFRTGEMPLGIADYTMYNTLQVSAPEIRGLWEFTRVPGTIKEDGSIDHTTPSGGQAVIIMNGSGKKESAWEFLKWWTSEEVQVRFGREMEGLMGPAARYPTANKEALAKLPWALEDYANLTEQFSWVKGIPEVPGGYFTGRNINNAFYSVVVSQNIGPREALMDNVRYINDEIAYKRKEFKLD